MPVFGEEMDKEMGARQMFWLICLTAPPSPHGLLQADGLQPNTPELTGGYKLRVRVRFFP